MRTRSTYHAECLCGGRQIASETTETICPDCNRLLVFEWQARPSENHEQPEQPPKAAVAAAGRN